MWPCRGLGQRSAGGCAGLLDQLEIISESTKETAKRMKGFRNILVQRYGDIDDGIVYEMATKRLEDFERFKKEVLEALSEEDALNMRR